MRYPKLGISHFLITYISAIPIKVCTMVEAAPFYNQSYFLTDMGFGNTDIHGHRVHMLVVLKLFSHILHEMAVPPLTVQKPFFFS